jgi:plasmid stabilization system protein ParE
MTVVFHPEAERELNEAIDWYEERAKGLGLDFADQIQDAVRRALAFPLAWQVLDGEIRRALVYRFPYGVLYAPEPWGIHVVAVMHLRREPAYWQNRLG